MEKVIYPEIHLLILLYQYVSLEEGTCSTEINTTPVINTDEYFQLVRLCLWLRASCVTEKLCTMIPKVKRVQV